MKTPAAMTTTSTASSEKSSTNNAKNASTSCSLVIPTVGVTNSHQGHSSNDNNNAAIVTPKSMIPALTRSSNSNVANDGKSRNFDPSLTASSVSERLPESVSPLLSNDGKVDVNNTAMMDTNEQSFSSVIRNNDDNKDTDVLQPRSLTYAVIKQDPTVITQEPPAFKQQATVIKQEPTAIKQEPTTGKAVKRCPSQISSSHTGGTDKVANHYHKRFKAHPKTALSSSSERKDDLGGSGEADKDTDDGDAPDTSNGRTTDPITVKGNALEKSNQKASAKGPAGTKPASLMLSLSSDDDDSDDDADMGKLSPFAQQAFDRREKALCMHETDADKALQKLLFTLGFGDTLFPHQCLAVRRAAGVPADFPLHKGSFATLKGCMTVRAASKGIDLVNIERGLLIADEMGLGKTIESIAGVIIYDALAEILDGGKQLPTVIVLPNTAVLEQWAQALRRNGVRAHRIHRFEKGMILDHIANKNHFLLLVKSKLQIEIKSIFDGIVSKTYTPKSSALFPNISYKGLRELHKHERVSKGKANLDEIDRLEDELGKKEAFDDCLRRSFADICDEQKLENKRAFRTCIIDEAHFLKNNLAFWGIAALLLGAHSQRVLPLTGTPYNNKAADVASIMAYIDPKLKYAYSDFWAEATSKGAHHEVREQLKGWTTDFLVRRSKESVLAGVLGAKTVETAPVKQHPDEIATQVSYEVAVQSSLDSFSKLSDEAKTPIAIARRKREFVILMCLISCARGASIHPMLPCGREFTIQFSPTRKNLSKVDKKTCVLCHQGCRPSIPIDREGQPETAKYRSKVEGPKVDPDGDNKKVLAGPNKGVKAEPKTMKKSGGGNVKTSRIRLSTDLDLDNEDLDDNEFDDATGAVQHGEEEAEEDGPLIALQCCEKAFGVQHYAHETCILQMSDCVTCPRCQDGKNRAMLNTRDFDSSGFKSEMYCTEICGGFKGSSKINEVVKAVKETNPNDKILVLSFFKSSLDLLEGIFIHDLGYECARFDGDYSSEIANSQLERFKKNASVRILLATVQSGGTGLNIVEANHVFFTDRWYNPFVHSQAMDRCYRIGQKKDVFVRFFDCGSSVDEVMAILNRYKQQNSTVILSDGTELGANSGGSLTYQEVSGLLSRAIKGLVTARADHIDKYGRIEAIPAASQALIDAILSDDLYDGRTYADHVAFMEAVNALARQRAEEAMKQRVEILMKQPVEGPMKQTFETFEEFMELCRKQSTPEQGREQK